MELDQSLQSRDEINRQIVSVLDEAGRAWGIKVLRYEVKSLTPPESILRAMEAADHRRAREAGADREVRGREAAGDQHRRRRRSQAAILKSEGAEDGADQLGAGRGHRARLVAEATAAAVRAVAEAMNAPGGSRRRT